MIALSALSAPLRKIAASIKRAVLNTDSNRYLTIKEAAKISNEPSEEEIKEMNSAIEEAKIAWLKNPNPVLKPDLLTFFYKNEALPKP